MRIVSVVGARPQFVKAAVVSRAFEGQRGAFHSLIHTGQHYDGPMSDVFFREMDIPKPRVNLGVGSGPHGKQTADMLCGLEGEFLKLRPEAVILYGDTNSTLAGALAASKLSIPVAHVEAGLRSFNRAMPEEINRIATDRLSTWLFAPTPEAVLRLRAEGMLGGVRKVGDVMVDALYFYRDRVRKLPAARRRRVIPAGPFFVLTLHRQENTDDVRRLRSIMRGLAKSPLPLVFPVHPRTRHALDRGGISLPRCVIARPPLGYLDMILLIDAASAVCTDSGGLQKEAVVLQKRCFTLRDETEWVETVQTGWNRLLGADTRRISSALEEAAETPRLRPFPVRRFYGDGHAGERMARILLKGTG